MPVAAFWMAPSQHIHLSAVKERAHCTAAAQRYVLQALFFFPGKRT